MEKFDASGLTFDVDDSGPAGGEVVILLHGFPATRRSWDQITPRLVDAGYRVLAPDQRGYSPGARPHGAGAYKLRLLADDVVALADAAGADRFHVVGHDWGGAVAWGLAGWHLDRLITMTSLATPHPRAMVRALWQSTQFARSWYMLLFQTPRLAEALVAGRGANFFRGRLEASGLPSRYATTYSEHLAQPGAATGGLNWYRALPLERPWELPRARVPVLYVYGTKDVALGPKAAELTARYVEGDYRFELLEAGHWLPEERPDEVSRLVLEQLGEFSDRAGDGSLA